MSNRDRTEAEVIRGDCAADSLRGLIAQVAGQIAEADRRHTEMLREMHARLAALGSEARSIRDRVPGEYVPAFARIEEGLELLVDRLAGSRPSASDQATDAAPASSHPTVESVEPSPAAIAAAVAAPLPADSPILAGFKPAFDPAEPWDRDQAEALAAIYHAGAVRTPDPDADHFAPAEALAVAPRALAADIERDWLESRFADIARRVEQSLAEMRPDRSIDTLGDKFDLFEQRMGTALEDVATRADVEGLRLIEAHISELAQHLEQAQAQLERLDGIEHQLIAVAQRLMDEPQIAPMPVADPATSEDRIEEIVTAAVERMASQMAAFRAGEPDALVDVASEAAERAVSRLAADFKAPGMASEDTVELREMLASFMRDHRQGEESTAAMLDSMQQAMIRVLDRIDAIELAQHQASQPHQYVREEVRFAPEPRLAGELTAGRTAVETAKGVASAAAHIAAQVQQAPAAAAVAPAASAAPMEARQPADFAVVPASPFAHVPGSEPVAGAPSLAADPARAPIDKLRQDFIADAQRAKLRAQQSASETAPAPARTAAGVTIAPPKAAAGSLPGAPKAANGKAKAPAAAAAEAGKAKSGLPVKKLLVGALGLVILIQGANLLLSKRKADAPKSPAAPTKAVPGAPAEKGALPKAETTKPAAPKAEAPKVDTRPSESQKSGALPAAPAAPAAQKAGEASETLSEDALDATNERPAPVEGKTSAPAAGQQRSEAAPGDGPILPSRPPGPRTVPETVVEDLNFNGVAPNDRNGNRVSAALDGTTPLGISLQSSPRPPTPYDLARLQQQQQMASMSSQLGVAAAKATPAALLPEGFGATAPQAGAAAPAAATAKSALDLPPATVGPLSLRLAAAKGDPSAEFEVAARLAEGKGTDQSFKEAVKWYTRSATQGFAQAQYRLGTLYERGLGIAKDPARARIWYGRAAEQGNVKAMHNLAVLAAGSKGTAPDYATAAHWFGEAASRGLADSQFNLAVLHESGLGVSQDAALAYQWFALAARSGDKEAVRRRDLAKAQLPIQRVLEVEKQIATWLPKSTDTLANDARAAGEAWKSRESADDNS